MSTNTSLSAPRARRPARWLLLPALIGVLVALTVGLLARAEASAPGTYPGGYFRLFFSDPLHLKVWFATAALAVALLQPFSGAWMFGKLPWRRPRWLAPAHRWTGLIVFLLTLPVAYHCIFRIGFRTTSDRVTTHAVLGCLLYGAFAAKVLIVRLRRFPSWAFVVAGGALFALLVAVWYTSALWLLRAAGVAL
jgi:hypothetical protein